MAASHERLVALIEAEGVPPGVVEAFRSVDRAGFVPRAGVTEAYADQPVALPERQTTSQPTLIARMVAAALAGGTGRVLEIGTGYGFQTAVLARLTERVFSVERHAVLAEAARRNLAAAGIDNAEVHVGDGWAGWPPGAPYDAIVVSAAATEVPEALAAQLGTEGRLVIPLKRAGSDDVMVFRRTQSGLEPVELLTPARFVPLVREDRP